jgi:hypothetical protein
MQRVRRVVGMLGLAAVLAAPAAAQEAGTVTLQATGGGVHGLAKLDPNGIYDTKTGLGLSGSVGYQVIRSLVARADVSFSKGAIRASGADYGADLNRVFVSAMAQLQSPSASGLNPYLLIGGGVTLLNQHATIEPKKTLAHGVGGAGLAYQLGKSGVSILAEGKVYLYQARGLVGNSADQQRVQFDASFGGGLSYAFQTGKH